MLSEKVNTTDTSASYFSKLEEIRENSGEADTLGLHDSEISNF